MASQKNFRSDNKILFNHQMIDFQKQNRIKINKKLRVATKTGSTFFLPDSWKRAK
jgi:hypothetical protein